jgi:serine phosphatase RsbU (regulator of sigma subunit)/anti-sigma regulatory factor (Ser/Thr protein kinase)
LHCLATAGRVLASTLDVASVIPELGRAVVPAHAEGLAIICDGAEGPTVLGVSGRVPPFEVVPAGGPDAGRGPILDLALVVRGRPLGTLRIARAAPIDEYAQLLFEEVARRLAVALDVARIETESHRVADTLQRALLPERLPRTGRHWFDAAYLPGTTQSLVGGDWYDAFALPDGRVALSIGDVAGHGLAAAVVMGEVRHAFRAAALNATVPSVVLERANAIVNMRAEPVMVTALFGFLDPGTSTLTYAVAGHPAPMLAMRDAEPERLPSGGIPLGIAPSVDARDWTFTIAPGSLLALYTDGLIEHSHDVIAGEASLLEALRAEAAGDTISAQSLLARALAGVKNTDDTVALVISVDDAPADEFFFEFSAVALAVPLARRALRRYAERQGLDDDRSFALVTAVGEAMANAVEHAYGDAVGNVRIRVACTADAIHATIEDDGRWKAAQKRDERGRGLPLMRALCEGVEIHTNQICTSIQLRIASA